jgi:N-acetyl-alpha-D-muramate 1-phosphate uridylyltransferase
MKTAMILAAGRGERMRPLTDFTPKPLLKIKGKALIEYHLEKLALAGFEKIVINHHWLGEQIEIFLGNGEKYGIQIKYSKEINVLETGGGIVQALPLLGEKPFLVVNGDIWCNLDFNEINLDIEKLAHLFLVSNPEHNLKGDFGLENGFVINEPQFTFSGIGIYHPNLFKDYEIKKLPLAPILRKAILEKNVTGEYFKGQWFDIGTPARLEMLETMLVV